MILSKDINPEKSIYYIGSLVIDSLNYWDDTLIDFFELYKAVNQKKTVTMQLFVLSIDWLFLLGLIKPEQHGKIEKCF